MNIYVITGAIQTGKTTWVARMLDTARQRWGAFELLDADSPVGPFLKKIAR